MDHGIEYYPHTYISRCGLGDPAARLSKGYESADTATELRNSMGRPPPGDLEGSWGACHDPVKRSMKSRLPFKALDQYSLFYGIGPEANNC